MHINKSNLYNPILSSNVIVLKVYNMTEPSLGFTECREFNHTSKNHWFIRYQNTGYF